jgi:putative membrane protein
MSWIRTAVSLIGFGFTIVPFFQRMEDLPGANPARHPFVAQYVGLALISCGILTLVISIWQYEWTVRYLQSGCFAAVAGLREGRMRTPTVSVAVLLILIGVFAFVAVPLRLL